MNKGFCGTTTKYAEGGPVLQKTNSIFLKKPDVFATGKERSDYGSKSKAGQGKDKSLPAVKPRS